MDSSDVSLVQDSFAKVAPIADTAADLFYERLFAIAPEVRPLFPDDMSEQKAKLMQTLAVAVRGLDRPETVIPALEDLGRRHVGYGVEAAHYDAVGAALLHTLARGLGDGWNPELERAWTRTYALVATTMQSGAAPRPAE